MILLCLLPERKMKQMMPSLVKSWLGWLMKLKQHQDLSIMTVFILLARRLI